jgi:hypothetical protein
MEVYMERKTSLKGLVAASVVALGMAAPAHAAVTCPDASEIKGSVRALNAVIRQSEKNFFVLTAQPAVNSSNLGWIVVTQSSGNGFDAAFANGGNSVKSVISAATEEAIEQQNMYICAYFTSSGGMNVMAIAPQQQRISFTPEMFNLDLFKKK